MPPTFGEEVAGQGWSTGAVIPPTMVLALAPYLTRPEADQSAQVLPDDWLVLVSQTCDVLAARLEAEPYVEVLHCRPVAKLRTQYKELRSTRTLDFKPNRTTHEAVALTAHAVADRYLLPRGLLREHVPDDRRLSDVSTARVLAWYALRYGRPTWPDELVARISKAKAALELTLNPLKDDIAEVRVAIAEKDQELAAGQDYTLAVYFVVDEAVWEGEIDGREAIHAAFAQFVSALDACVGITVDQDLSEVVSGAEFTWQDTKATDEWNFANLSHRE